jgi:hypothetical protein
VSPDPAPRRKFHPALKAAIVLAVLAGVGYLFVRSVADTRAEPYEISAAHLTGWTLADGAAQDLEGAALALRPPAELPMNLFRQLFRRQMESLSTPMEPGIALVLRQEVPATVTPMQLMALAREAGVDRARPTPRCVGYRRVSATGVTRQLYFVWFPFPEYDEFRRRIAPLVAAAYRPDALSPVMLTAAEPDVSGWHPVVVDEARDCVAPVTVR